MTNYWARVPFPDHSKLRRRLAPELERSKQLVAQYLPNQKKMAKIGENGKRRTPR